MKVREGLSKKIDEHDLLGESTSFRKICSKFVKNVVEQGKWFTFCTKIDAQQIDIMGIKNNEGVSLGSMVRDVYPEMQYRPAIYKYLLSEFLCYYEAPLVIKEKNTNGWKNSFDKSLVTSNINVLAEWMGITYEEADAEYGGKLQFYDEDDTNDVPYYKLYTTKEGVRKVTKTRKDLDVSQSGARIIPLFALKEGVDVLYKYLLEDTYNVTFCKDSSQKRDMNVTFNIEKIKEVYSDQNYITGAVNAWYEGDFLENPNMERGYIRVFEMGSSIYDSPTRSINYARITGFYKAEPDLTYMNIDLDSVMQVFINTVKGNVEINKNIQEFVDALEVFDVGTTRRVNNLDITSVQSLIVWAEGQMVLLSTVFLRSLALFMLGNPQWFEGYTGEPTTTSGYNTSDWDDMELDLG